MLNNRGGRRWSLSSVESNFLKSEIECGIPARTKRALQTVCQVYRNSGSVLSADLNGFENAILGVLNSGASDEKVRRWSLAAISQLGRRENCWLTVLNVIAKYPEEPQVVSAAIAALFKFDLRTAQSTILATDEISPQLLLLSALQTTPSKDLDLSGLQVNIDTADPTTLKLCLVLVGLNKSPPHIFDPRFSNAQIVKVLGGHHEPLVSQYSAWAAAESPVLSASDLGIDIKKLDQQPENVRSYVYRLYGSERTYSHVQHEIIDMGSNDESVEARLGLAIGVRDTWYNGLDTLCQPWLHDETDDDVRDHVLDHVVSQAKHSRGYWLSSVDFYQEAERDLRKRQRMEAAAWRTDLYREFKRMVHQEEEGLFGDRGIQSVTNNNIINNHGTMGQTTQSGDIINKADNQNVLTIHQVGQARQTLEVARDQVRTIDITPITEEALAAIDKAHDMPTKDTLGTAVSSLKKVEEGLSSVAASAGTAIKIGGLITTLAAMI